MMNDFMTITRRTFLNSSGGFGGLALATLLAKDSMAKNTGIVGLPHKKPKAKSVIYLFQSGGPSHIDLFDYHPESKKLHGTDLPASVRGSQRVTGMTAGASFEVLEGN